MHLALYTHDSCPYCQRVYRAIEQLGVEVEKRDVMDDPSWREELFDVRQRGTVPVLRIAHEGEVRWLPESSDIIAWLHDTFGGDKKRPGTDRFHRIATFGMWALLVLGVFVPERQAVCFAAALALGAFRSIRMAWMTRSWVHGVISVLFVLGGAAVALQHFGMLVIPWWYAVYAFVALLALAMMVVRVRGRGSPEPQGS